MRTHLILALPFAIACGSATPDGTTNGDPSNGSMPTNPGMGNAADGGAATLAKLGDVGLAFAYDCPHPANMSMLDINNDGRADFLFSCNYQPVVGVSQSDGSLKLAKLP